MKKQKKNAKKNFKKHSLSLETGKIQIEKAAKTQEKGKEERTKTGINGLDEVMGGGFEEDSINIVCGGPGSGKSIFALQFLVNGAEKYNEPGIYITFEESKNKIIKHMKEFGWDLKELEKKGKLEIIEYTPEHVKKLLTEGGGEVDLAVEKIKARRIVIDSLTAFALLFKDELARMEAFLDLFKLIQKWECTALLISEEEQDVEKHHASTIEFEVDGIVLLYNLRKDDVRKRALEILKLRGTQHSNKLFPMKITNKGITIYPEETLF